MATIIGRNAKVAVSTDNFSASDEDVGKILSATLSFDHDRADETNNDSAGWKEGKYADSSASLSFTFKYNEADLGQAMLVTASANKTIIYYRFRPEEAVGENSWVFQGIIDSLSVDISTGEVEEGSCDVTSTGTITNTVQT